MGLFFDEYHTHNHNHISPGPQNVSISHGPKTVNVTEKRAVTDDSIRILNEMQEKAMANLLGRLPVNDNYLKAQAVHYKDPGAWCNGIAVRYTYNGHERIVRYTYDNQETDFKKILSGLHKALSEDIGRVIMNSCLMDISSSLMNAKYGV